MSNNVIPLPVVPPSEVEHLRRVNAELLYALKELLACTLGQRPDYRHWGSAKKRARAAIQMASEASQT